MKTYLVTIPLAGHFSVEVEAESKEQAIEKAQEADPKDGELQYEYLTRFNQGNVCYCPQPWELEVKCKDEDSEGI